MHKGFLKTSFLLAALSVILGAFAAHGLKKIIAESSLVTFETGVKYQFYHALGLMMIGILYQEYKSKYVLLAGKLFIVGTLLFSGSLYLLALLKPSYTFIGAITPFGGLSFIVGWVLLFLGVSKKR
jgi:uncharacterized membrane protein YgdD (TMEM256/DUF423 family)